MIAKAQDLSAALRRDAVGSDRPRRRRASRGVGLWGVLALALAVVASAQDLPLELQGADPLDDRWDIPATQRWRIAFVSMADWKQSYFWLRAKEGAEAAAEEFDVDVQLFHPETDAFFSVDEQIETIREVIGREPDGLVIAPVDGDRLVPVVEEAIAAGIPTVVFDQQLRSRQVLTQLLFDNSRAGRILGEWVAGKLRGEGQVAILEGIPGAINSLERRIGFEQGLEQTGERIEVVASEPAQWLRSEAFAIGQRWLRTLDGLDAVLAASDPMALGMVDAEIDAHRSENLLVVGIDGNPEALAAIEQGSMDATVNQQPELQSRKAVQLLIRHLEHGEAYPPVLKWTENSLITSANVEDSVVEVVHTGIRFHEISDFRADQRTVILDFTLWFRHEGSAQPENLVFLDSVEPFSLGDPVEEQIAEGVRYAAYRVQQPFKADFLPTRSVLDQHVVGVRFRHRDLLHNDLIYVPDPLGMGLVEESGWLASIRRPTVFRIGTEWRLIRAEVFADKMSAEVLGRPDYLAEDDSSRRFSSFNAAVYLEKNRIFLRGNIDTRWALLVVASSLAFLVILGLVARWQPHYSPILWVLAVAAAFVLLQSGEVVSIDLLADRLDDYLLSLVVRGFEILGWLVATLFAVLAVEQFLWRPLEERTGRSVPRLARGVVSTILLTLGVFGIISFVFGQKITGLLATSGLLAMIIGLAVQMNISHIFSGLAINIEQPLRVGDWVKIGEIGEGEVIDVTWRTTKILNRHQVMVSIPNSSAAESPIHNYSLQSSKKRLGLRLTIPSRFPVAKVKKILNDAVLATPEVLLEPAHEIYMETVDQGAIDYSLEVAIDDYSSRFAITEALWERLLIHLHGAGIYLVGDPIPEDERSKIIRFIDLVKLFEPLAMSDKIELAQGARRHRLAPEEVVMKQGESGSSLFIVAEGCVSVAVARAGGPGAGGAEAGDSGKKGSEIEIARLGVGETLGGMALLTGRPRIATVTAVTDSRLVEIRKEQVALILERETEIAQQFADLLARQFEETQRLLEVSLEAIEPRAKLSERLAGEIHRIFAKP